MDLDKYSYEEDNRRYVDPNVALAEQNAFINNLRNIQAQNTAQATMQTRNLGTQVPSNLGGLVGGGSYFASRYRTPQSNSAIADLRAAAQAQALSQALQNELDKYKKKYKDSEINASLNSNKDVTLDIGDEGSENPLLDTRFVEETNETNDSNGFGETVLNGVKNLLPWGTIAGVSTGFLPLNPVIGQAYDLYRAFNGYKGKISKNLENGTIKKHMNGGW